MERTVRVINVDLVALRNMAWARLHGLPDNEKANNPAYILWFAAHLMLSRNVDQRSILARTIRNS